MNSQTEGRKCCQCASRCAYIVAIVGAFLIVWVMLRLTRHYTRPEPLGEDRAKVRINALKELRAQNQDILHNPNYVWQDAAKGIVRMPIERAMELSLKLWQDPAAGRSNLIARVEKATAVVPQAAVE